MKVWEIREDWDNRHGYKRPSMRGYKEDSYDEAYECGYEDGYKAAMSDVKHSHGERGGRY